MRSRARWRSAAACSFCFFSSVSRRASSADWVAARATAPMARDALLAAVVVLPQCQKSFGFLQGIAGVLVCAVGFRYGDCVLRLQQLQRSARISVGGGKLVRGDIERVLTLAYEIKFGADGMDSAQRFIAHDVFRNHK